MAKKIFVPMTLENVGSEGKLFTDGTLIKILGSLLIALLVSALICQKLLYWVIPPFGLWIGIAIFILVSQFLIRKWPFCEGLLKNMYAKLTKHKTVNVGKFTDIYDVLPGGICLHENGQISCFVEIIRGTTLGLNKAELDRYVNVIKTFEDSILRENFALKHCNIEIIDNDYSLFKKQKLNCYNYGMHKLEKNLDVKNTYIKTFMDYCVRDERDIYIIVSKYANIDMFRMKINQLISNLANPIIVEVKILENKEEIREFGKQFNDVDLFEIESIEEDELKDIIKFKGDN